MSEKKQCAGLVYRADVGRSGHCQARATLEHNGKWWCRAHHPPSRAVKDKALGEKWRAESMAESQKRAAYAKLRALEEWALAWMRAREPELVEKKEREL